LTASPIESGNNARLKYAVAAIYRAASQHTVKQNVPHFEKEGRKMETMLKTEPARIANDIAVNANAAGVTWKTPNAEPRILVVDDDPAMADLIAAMLESTWLNCVVRSSGAQGIQAFAGEPVDVIITDLRMAAGDGVALIESIRRTSLVPVIIVTGFAREFADRVRFLENVALIHKPFDRRQLMDLVERALQIRQPDGGKGWNLPPFVGESL